jgi:hypothetical protein
VAHVVFSVVGPAIPGMSGFPMVEYLVASMGHLTPDGWK